jgi:hypothetical protein
VSGKQTTRALRHLHPQIFRRRARPGIQLARCPARGRRGLYQKPGPHPLRPSDLAPDGPVDKLGVVTSWSSQPSPSGSSNEANEGAGCRQAGNQQDQLHLQLHRMWLAVNSIRDYERVLARHRRQGETRALSSRFPGSLLKDWECSMLSSFPRKSRSTLRSKAKTLGCGR